MESAPLAGGFEPVRAEPGKPRIRLEIVRPENLAAPVGRIPGPTQRELADGQVSERIDGGAGRQRPAGGGRQQPEIRCKLPVRHLPAGSLRNQPDRERTDFERTVILHVNPEIAGNPDLPLRQDDDDLSGFTVKHGYAVLLFRKHDLAAADIERNAGAAGRNIDRQRQRIGRNGNPRRERIITAKRIFSSRRHILDHIEYVVRTSGREFAAQFISAAGVLRVPGSRLQSRLAASFPSRPEMLKKHLHRTDIESSLRLEPQGFRQPVGRRRNDGQSEHGQRKNPLSHQHILSSVITGHSATGSNTGCRRFSKSGRKSGATSRTDHKSRSRRCGSGRARRKRPHSARCRDGRRA